MDFHEWYALALIESVGIELKIESVHEVVKIK